MSDTHTVRDPNATSTDRARWAAEQLDDTTFTVTDRWSLWATTSAITDLHVDENCCEFRGSFGARVPANNRNMCDNVFCRTCAPDGSTYRQMITQAHALSVVAHVLGWESWWHHPRDIWHLLNGAHTDPWCARTVRRLRDRQALGPAFAHDIGVLCVIDTGITELNTYTTWAAAATDAQVAYLELLTIRNAARTHAATVDALNQELDKRAPGTVREQQRRQHLLGEIGARGQELAQIPITRYMRATVTDIWTAEAISHLRGAAGDIFTRDANFIVGGHPVLLDSYFDDTSADTVEVVRSDSLDTVATVTRVAAELEGAQQDPIPFDELIHVASAVTI
jgi:hypothetical protein